MILVSSSNRDGNFVCTIFLAAIESAFGVVPSAVKELVTSGLVYKLLTSGSDDLDDLLEFKAESVVS